MKSMKMLIMMKIKKMELTMTTPMKMTEERMKSIAIKLPQSMENDNDENTDGYGEKDYVEDVEQDFKDNEEAKEDD